MTDIYMSNRYVHTLKRTYTLNKKNYLELFNHNCIVKTINYKDDMILPTNVRSVNTHYMKGGGCSSDGTNDPTDTDGTCGGRSYE